MWRRVLSLALVLTLCCAGPALGQSRQSGSFQLTTTQPGAATGNAFSLDFRNPANPAGKPYSVKRIVLRLSPGSRIDTSVPEQCKASDAELILRGTAACPPGSRVGGGTILTDNGSSFGFPRFVRNTVTNFNNAGEMIGLAESSNPQTRVVSRARISGSTVTFDIPPLPGTPPPDAFNAFRDFRLSGQAIVRNGRPYARTPLDCPSSGRWPTFINLTYQDDVTQTISTSSPCRAGSSARDRYAPRIRVGGVPRKRCASGGFTARARITERLSSLRRVAMYLDGKAIRVSRRHRIRGRVRAQRLRPGVHRLTVKARDGSGNRNSRTERFRRCAR